MKVLKFGGSSVGTPGALTNVRSIIQQTPGPKVVVVSALGGITDLLIETARTAARGGNAFRQGYDNIVGRHMEMAALMAMPHLRQQTVMQIEELLGELGDIFTGISLIRDLSPRALDMTVSYGERLSSIIVASMFADCTLLDARQIIKTHRTEHGAHTLDADLTATLIRKAMEEVPANLTVIGGFIASDSEGDVTNLGRGGSDYTASVMAAALDAEVLEIWTDVDGFMTADPRVIDSAYVIDELSYAEAMELCNFGAKVVYPPTIYPAYHSGIPIMVRNTFNPSAPGTRISNDPKPSRLPIRGISSVCDTALVTLSSLCMVGVVGVNTRIFSALSRHGVSVFLVSQAASENNTTVAVRNADAELAARLLRKEFASEIASGMYNGVTVRHDLATVAVVGENMRDATGIMGKVFNTVGRNGINVIACAQGARQLNISFVVERRQLQKTLNVIHDSFFLSECQVLNLFIAGVGNVGGALLRQIATHRDRLLRDKRLRLNVVGIASSRHAVFDAEGIDPARYREILDGHGQPVSPQELCATILKMNLYNPVFVDCTASHAVAGIYGELLDNFVNVVAANKIAASGPYPVYQALKQTARNKDVKFLFETNVGAGLPIISTINSLINSGDTILGIQAVVSGTLNYLFNVIGPEVPFSRAVGLAKEEGYTEPDPRIDLSGTDVVRKLVILGREAGYSLETDDVVKHLFVPQELFDLPADEFMQALPALDTGFEQLRREVEARGEKFRFVASLSPQGAQVRLETVAPGHPFHNLEGSNNVILITTDRYRDFPMAIKGYGAGAEVTAAGVFADIISIANIR